MKKLGWIGMLFMVVALMFTGCSQSGSESVQLKDGETLESVVTSITEELTMPMPAQVDDTILKDVFYVDPEDTNSYFGQFAMVNVSSANVIVVEAKGEDQVASIQESLEKRKDDVCNSFEMYLPDQYEIAQNGKVVTKGNYVALLMIENVDRAEEIFNEAFQA